MNVIVAYLVALNVYGGQPLVLQTYSGEAGLKECIKAEETFQPRVLMVRCVQARGFEE